MGASSDAVRTSGFLDVFLHGSLKDGAAGLLVSPSKGLFVFMPWTIFAVWGGVRLWKEKTFPWAPYVVAAVAALFLVYAKYDRWWGGWCFGPRYLTDLLPFLAFFLVAAWPRIQAMRAAQVTFALTVMVAFWVQLVGAYYYPMGHWDGKPINVDVAPERVWVWYDTQVMRNWRAGPAPPDMYFRWKAFVERRRSAVHKDWDTPAAAAAARALNPLPKTKPAGL